MKSASGFEKISLNSLPLALSSHMSVYVALCSRNVNHRSIQYLPLDLTGPEHVTWNGLDVAVGCQLLSENCWLFLILLLYAPLA
jgi:hypothetical protein